VGIILLLFISACLRAQFYEYGQDAGSLKWYQFHTPHFNVIYPVGVDSLANSFANRLEYYYPYLGKPLDHQHSKMPVILHNESSFSNGVFVWAPKRLEIFTNPDPNEYHMDWLTELALHEGRHAVQIDKLNQGFTRALSFLGGEQMVGAMAAFLPYWYLEGDAVDAETRLSRSGRGRQPSFEMEMKAQLLESDRIHSFSKATMGSYKHYIPNHYKVGYLMVKYGRMTHGDEFWIDFQQYAARKPYLLNPTFFSMRKYGVASKKQFYKDALNSYQSYWSDLASKREQTPFTDWNLNRDRHYTSYRFPHFVSNSMLFAYKSGMDQIPEFVFLGKGGKEQSIFRPGYLNSGRISFSGQHVVWDELVPDLRWSNRNYSVIRTYEIATGAVRNLGRKTRYYSPDVSKDGSRIVAIEQTDNQVFSLVILDFNGNLLERIASPGNGFIQHPAWMESDTALVVILSDSNGKSLYRYTLDSGNWNRIFEAGTDNISYPTVIGDRIFFSGTFSGIDNIYCHQGSENKVYQVTSSRFGAFHPQVSSDRKQLFYSNYTAKGYGIAAMPVDEGLWKPLEEARDHTEQMGYDQTPEEQDITSGAANMESVKYVSKKYHKALHLFNFHSWLPLYFDYLNPEFNLNPEQLPISPGVSLVSQNKLSTAVSQLGYEYRQGYHLFHSGIRLKGRYPVVNLNIDYGGESNVLLLAEGDSIVDVPNDLRFNAQAYVPFRLNTGKYLSIIQPRVDYTYRRDIQYVESTGNYSSGAHYLYYSLYASSYLRKGLKDILPRIGLTASGGYYHAPFNHQVYGAVSRASLTGYIPGILKHQTIRLAFDHQKQYPLELSRPAFINLMGLPRGMRNIFGEVLTKYSADYILPLVYPDLELSALVYLKRIRAAFWADHMVGANVVIVDPEPHYENRTYTSVGLDLIADLNLFRISFPFSIGGRITYEPETGVTGLEWIYSVDIN